MNKLNISTLINIAKKVDENLIPANTTYVVDLNGNGDFTSLQAAIEFLNNKTCNGTLILQLNAGTYNFNAPLIISAANFNISRLHIVGNGIDNTILQFNHNSDWEDAIEICGHACVYINDLTITRPNGTKSTLYRGLSVRNNSFLYIHNIKINGCYESLLSTLGSCINIADTVTIQNAGYAISCYGARIDIVYNCIINLNNINTGLFATHGGIITNESALTINKTNVMQLSNTLRSGVVVSLGS